ncbi:MAG: hypothetical protein HGA82_01440, partial [Anaerolineales bacterium]|nr:hypothetical protein [Anaerolineales bacterium]
MHTFVHVPLTLVPRLGSSFCPWSMSAQHAIFRLARTRPSHWMLSHAHQRWPPFATAMVGCVSIQSALTASGGPGWVAGETGEQTIRLLFDEPQALRQIQLVFEEEKRERTHEFVLRWSGDDGRSYREILRQQYTFSPPGATREVEDYVVNLHGVTVLELRIVPDISRG